MTGLKPPTLLRNPACDRGRVLVIGLITTKFGLPPSEPVRAGRPAAAPAQHQQGRQSKLRTASPESGEGGQSRVSPAPSL